MWNLKLTAAGQTLNVPMHLVQTSAPEAASGYSTSSSSGPPRPTCLQARPAARSSVPSCSGDLRGLRDHAACGGRRLRWTSLWTLYNPGKGTPNAAGSVETQAVRHIPTPGQLTITKKKVVTSKVKRINGSASWSRRSARLSGSATRVTENAAAPGSARDHDDRSRQEGRRRVRFVLPRLRQVGDGEVDGRGRQRHGQRARPVSPRTRQLISSTTTSAQRRA